MKYGDAVRLKLELTLFLFQCELKQIELMEKDGQYQAAGEVGLSNGCKNALSDLADLMRRATDERAYIDQLPVTD